MKILSNEWRKLDRRAKNKYFKIWRKADKRERRAPFFVCLDCILNGEKMEDWIK